MDPACRRANRRRNILKKSDDVVVRAFLDLQNFRNRKARLLAKLSRVLLWNLAELGHRFARKNFNLEPDLKFALVGPNLRHLRPRITIDHAAKIDSRAEHESVLWGKENRSGRLLPERFEIL